DGIRDLIVTGVQTCALPISTRVTLVAHTHWDREWYLPFERLRAHLVEVLDEAITLLERDPRLHFTLDGHVALVDDYLEMRPDARSEERRVGKEWGERGGACK